MSRLRLGPLALALFAFGWAAPVAAQASPSTTFTVTGTPNVFPAPTAADFDAGFIMNPNPIHFEVSFTTGPPGSTRVATVTIRSESATFGAKPLSDLQWSWEESGIWTPITLNPVTVATQSVVRSVPWNSYLYLGSDLDWETEPLGTHTANIVLRLTITSP